MSNKEDSLHLATRKIFRDHTGLRSNVSSQKSTHRSAPPNSMRPAATDVRVPAQSYEDLEIWQEAMDMATETFLAFRHCREYGLREEIQRAALLIPSKIAEGFEKQGQEDFLPYLYAAKGACAEVRTAIELALNLQSVAAESGDKILNLSCLLGEQIHRYIQARRLLTRVPR